MKLQVLFSLILMHTVSKNVLNPFPNKPWFLRVYGTILLKTLWEKEKMLVTSIFSFSYSIFYSIKQINHHSQHSIFWLQVLSIWLCPKFCCLEKGYLALNSLTLYHTIPTFNDPDKDAFCKHCGKRRKCQ